jgi:hypothetical protein
LYSILPSRLDPFDTLPAKTFNNVVFPAPEDPIIANIVPGFTTPVTPLRRVRVPGAALDGAGTGI